MRKENNSIFWLGFEIDAMCLVWWEFWETDKVIWILTHQYSAFWKWASVASSPAGMGHYNYLHMNTQIFTAFSELYRKMLKTSPKQLKIATFKITKQLKMLQSYVIIYFQWWTFTVIILWGSSKSTGRVLTKLNY